MKIFAYITQLYRALKERLPDRYREGVAAYERAFLRLLGVSGTVTGTHDRAIGRIHSLYVYCVEPCLLERTEEFSFEEETCVWEIFLKFLCNELCLEREFVPLVLDGGLVGALPESSLKRCLIGRRTQLENRKFAEQYFRVAEKYNGLSTVTGIAKRDLYIPLKGSYLDRVNETEFYLEDEIARYAREENVANVLLLFGEAGQGKSTFVRSYYCRAFFEEDNVFLFKLTDILPVLFRGYRLDVGSFLQEYGLERDALRDGAFFIFDGLDEAAGELSARSYQLAEFINELEEDLSDMVRNCKLLFTSRPQGVENSLFGYEKIRIAGLSFEDQKEWVRKYSALSGDGEFSEHDLQQIRAAFPELTKLMETPLLFEMIVAHGVNVNIKNRVYLFERLFKDTILSEKRREIHRLFERIALEEFARGTGGKVEKGEADAAYHQGFVEFYHTADGALGAEFTHRSFYQHFLCYGLVNAFLTAVSAGEALKGFLRHLGTRRLEKFELENIAWIVQREHIGLTEEQIGTVFDELVKNNAIYASENRRSLHVAGIVFVNCIDLVNALAMKTIRLDGIRRETFNELLRTYDNFGIQLCNFDLSFYTLVGARLANANFQGVEMKGCDLARADLCCANFKGADLNGSYLRGADLRGACLEDADLSECNLSNSYLSGSNLRGCNLKQAYLINSNMLAADLRGANLKNANMQGAILNEASYEQEALDQALRTREQLIAYIRRRG